MSATKQDTDLLNLPEIESSEVVFDDFGELRRDVLRLPNQEQYSYYTMTTRKVGVLIVATTADSQLVLVEEYRHPTQRILLGFPGGFVDEGETVLAAAQRELLEETGFTAASFTIVGKAYPLPGLLNQLTYYVRAKGAEQISPPSLEGSEVLRPVLLTRKELRDQALEGRELDASLCAALFFAHE